MSKRYAHARLFSHLLVRRSSPGSSLFDSLGKTVRFGASLHSAQLMLRTSLPGTNLDTPHKVTIVGWVLRARAASWRANLQEEEANWLGFSLEFSLALSRAGLPGQQVARTSCTRRILTDADSTVRSLASRLLALVARCWCVGKSTSLSGRLWHWRPPKARARCACVPPNQGRRSLAECRCARGSPAGAVGSRAPGSRLSPGPRDHDHRLAAVW